MTTTADEYVEEARQEIYEAVNKLKHANELILKALDKDTYGSNLYIDIFREKLKVSTKNNLAFILNQPLLEY